MLELGSAHLFFVSRQSIKTQFKLCSLRFLVTSNPTLFVIEGIRHFVLECNFMETQTLVLIGALHIELHSAQDAKRHFVHLVRYQDEQTLGDLK